MNDKSKKAPLISVFSYIRKSLNYLSRETYFILFGVFIITPFIIISFFDQPVADDFCFVTHYRIFGFWGAQLNWYTTWTGRYFATAILSVNPALWFKVFFIYKLIPLILIAALFFSIYYLVCLIFVSEERKGVFLLTLFILAIYLFLMPSIAQGIYWMSSAITYQLGNVLAILLFCNVIKLMRTGKLKFLIACVILMFCVAGSNEAVMTLVDFLLTLIFILNFISVKKINYLLLTVLIFAALFSGIVIFAPGNFIRETFFPDKHQFLHSVFNSIEAVIYYGIKWVPLLLIFTLIGFDSFKKYTGNSFNSIFNFNPVVASIIFCCIPVVGFFPSFWSTNYVEIRTANTIYLFFLMGFLYLLFVLFFYLRKRGINFLTIPGWVRYVLVVLLLINLIQKNNIRDAYVDLIKGYAWQYNAALNERYRLITTAIGDTCFVPPLKLRPYSLSIDDIRSDSKDWRNVCYDAYWHNKPIVIKK